MAWFLILAIVSVIADDLLVAHAAWSVGCLASGACTFGEGAAFNQSSNLPPSLPMHSLLGPSNAIPLPSASAEQYEIGRFVVASIISTLVMSFAWYLVIGVLPRAAAACATLLVPPISGTDANATCISAVNDHLLLRYATLARKTRQRAMQAREVTNPESEAQ